MSELAAWSPYQLAILEFMRQEYGYFEAKLNGFSGADRADSQVHLLSRLVYQAALEGDDSSVTLEIARLDGQWREYAAEQARKVDMASKTKSGPYTGVSSIHWRWVSPELFANRVLHLRAMIENAREKHGL